MLFVAMRAERGVALVKDAESERQSRYERPAIALARIVISPGLVREMEIKFIPELMV